MKEEQQQRRAAAAAAFTSKNCTKPTAYVILLFFSYVLGYLSSPSSRSQFHHSLRPTAAQERKSQSTAAAAAVTATATALSAIKLDDHFRFATRCPKPVSSKLVRQTILQNVFNGTSPYDNFPPVHVANLLRSKRVKGWGSYGGVFENLIRKVKPRTIIEVGTFLGASALHMANLTRKHGLRTQIVCVDDFRGWPGFHERFRDMKMVNGDVLLLYQYMQNVIQANAVDSVLFVPFSTGSALENLCKWGVYADLIEVDAGHDFHSAWSDINRAYKLLRPGGVIFGHDYFLSADNKGVRRAVDLFARANGLRVRVDGQHWVLESA